MYIDEKARQKAAKYLCKYVPLFDISIPGKEYWSTKKDIPDSPLHREPSIHNMRDGNTRMKVTTRSHRTRRDREHDSDGIRKTNGVKS